VGEGGDGGAHEPQNNANNSIAVLDRFVMHMVPNHKVNTPTHLQPHPLKN
jgi:hypothetical protein